MCADDTRDASINEMLDDAGYEPELRKYAVSSGLKPYSDFEKALSPQLERVPPPRRNTLLNEMYSLAARKVVMERVGRALEQEAKEFRARRQLLIRTRTHIENARKELSVAQATFPPEFPEGPEFNSIIEKLRGYEGTLLELERFLARDVHPDLRTEAEDSTPPPTIQLVANLLGEELFAPPLPLVDERAADKWFIPALDKCLGEPPPGKRSRFNRDDVIQKILEFIGQPWSTKRIKAIRKPPNPKSE